MVKKHRPFRKLLLSYRKAEITRSLVVVSVTVLN